MSLANLNAEERDVVRQCLHAAVEGPFFSDWEFGTLFGLERDEIRRVLQSWPNIGETDHTIVVAINNSFNNLLGYPLANKHDIWPKLISVDHVEVARIFDQWRGRSVRTSYTPRDYFDGLI